MVGFTGSRHLSQHHFPFVAQVVRSVASRGVAVGCAAGADKAVRLACPAAKVFYASSFSGPPAARLVKRSVAMVRFVAGSQNPLIIGFVTRPCPAGLSPSPSPSACFAGFGSGTWATLALAAGLGVPVVVFGVPGPARLPAGWGGWQHWGSLGGWQLAPAAVQQSLF